MKKVREIRDAEASLRRSLGRAPERGEISTRLSKSVNKIDQVLQFTMREVSLDDKVGKDRDKAIAEYLVDPACSSPEHDLINRESNSLVGEAMAHLTEQERIVVAFRFGLAGGPPLTPGNRREDGHQPERVLPGRVSGEGSPRLFTKKRMVKALPKKPFPSRRRQDAPRYRALIK
jgi:hypothetical protein